jgi:photosystem II stability/assembly factor-like uncharacterized protein
MSVVAAVAVIAAALVVVLVPTAAPASASAGVPAALDAVACPTADHCVAVGGAGRAFVSADGGTTWSAASLPTRHYLYGVACPSPSRCIAVGDAGTVLAWSVARGTWAKVHSGTGQPLAAVSCTTGGRCTAVGDGGTFVTSTDGGSHFKVATFGNAVVDGVSCSSGTRCVAVTSNAEDTLRTVDGVHWSPASVQAESLLALLPMNAVSCAGAVCVSVGGHGLLARSADGGATFAFAYPAVTSEVQNGVFCASASRCLSVGAGGTVLLSGDGGAAWAHEPSSTTQTLLAVTCTGLLHCVAVGSGSTILSSSDGGLRWVKRQGTATAGHRLTVLMVGDSFAHTLALYTGRNAAAYGVTIDDGGLDGCALARGDILGNPGGPQGAVQPVSGACATAGPGWPDVYRSDVAADRPQVSLIVIGPWDLSTRLVGGQWISPGQPAYDAYYEGQLATAVQVLAGGHGHVVIATAPFIHTTGPDRCSPGSAPEAQCPSVAQRVAAVDAAAAAVAARFPGRVTMARLGQKLAPDGRYARTVAGVVVRAADGVHLSEPGGEWLTPWLFPRLQAAAQARS